MRAWLTLTIAEPFPVDPRSPGGPFYTPGAKWYYFPKDRRWVELCAEAQRQKGYTVTVAEEVVR